MTIFKRIIFVVFLSLIIVSTASCGFVSNNQIEQNKELEDLISLDEYKKYIIDDLHYVLKCFEEQVSALTYDECLKQKEIGEEAINNAKSVKAVKEAYDAAKENIAKEIPLASGIFDYSQKNPAQKTEILGILESYAVRNGLTGLSLFENGTYVMYSERLNLGTENYIPFYGFGILEEGSINAPLEYEECDDWKYYYHILSQEAPKMLNVLNDQSYSFDDYYNYFGASFVTTFMNDAKDGYEWVSVLAKGNPIPVAVEGLDENGKASKWRYEVRIGDELKYNTNSKMVSRQVFNGRNVALDDYLTPFKLLLTQSNGLLRGRDLANSIDGFAIKGAKAYFDATFDETLSNDVLDVLWQEVALRVYEEDGKAYFEWETTIPLTPYHAMYYMQSKWFMPIPQDFIDLVTIDNYLGFNVERVETPVDNSLSLGAYTLEVWEENKEIVYKKNPYYIYADEKYQVEGIHINILSSIKEDPNISFNEFLLGHIDEVIIPYDCLYLYKDDPRTRQTKGDSNFRLNINALDKATWEKLFGEDGTVTKTSKDDYWQVEPALSNEHFLRALSYSINRLELAAQFGYTPTVNYLASSYMSDGEKGLSYVLSKDHINATERLLEETTYGYNLDLARNYFKVALLELEKEGLYKRGTPDDPTIIEFEIAWLNSSQEEQFHKEISKYLEFAFNDPSVAGGCYKLITKFWASDVWSDIYYKKLMVGQFDLGYGNIASASVKPYNLFCNLSSDSAISGGFTINWGPDTNDLDTDFVVFDGMRFSFDALTLALNGCAVVKDGKNYPPFIYITEIDKTDSSINLTIEIDSYPNCTIEDLELHIFGYMDNSYLEYTLTQPKNSETNVRIEEKENGYSINCLLAYEDYHWINLNQPCGINLIGKTIINGKISKTGNFATINLSF